MEVDGSKNIYINKYIILYYITLYYITLYYIILYEIFSSGFGSDNLPLENGDGFSFRSLASRRDDELEEQSPLHCVGYLPRFIHH